MYLIGLSTDLLRGPSFRYELLAALISAGLLDHAFANELLPTLPHDFPTKLSLEAQEFGTEVEVSDSMLGYYLADSLAPPEQRPL